jgi:predicted dehydrogenase
VANGIGLGIIGCGDVALRSYGPALARLSEQAATVAVYDPDPSRAAALADDFAARGAPRPRVVASLPELLADPAVTAVFDLAPPPFHHEINMAVLAAGKHLFSEKPLAANLDDARAQLALAREQDVLFLGAPAVMATPRFRWLKDQLASGWLGRPLLASGQYANMGPAVWLEYKGDPAVFYTDAVGPAFDTGVYILHAITGIFGPARRVEAFGGIAIPQRNVLIPGREGQVIEVTTPDQFLIHLDFGDNRFAQVLSSFATPRSKAPALEIHGEQGSISIPSMESFYDPQGSIALWRREEQPGAVDGWTEVSPPGTSRMTHLVEVAPEHFVGVLTGEDEPILTAEHATHVLEIILAARASMREGCAVDVGDRVTG